MEKNKLVNFGPHCFTGNEKPFISHNLHLITFLFPLGGKRNCFKFEVYNLLCYNNKTYCVYMCGSLSKTGKKKCIQKQGNSKGTTGFIK